MSADLGELVGSRCRSNLMTGPGAERLTRRVVSARRPNLHAEGCGLASGRFAVNHHYDGSARFLRIGPAIADDTGRRFGDLASGCPFGSSEMRCHRSGMSPAQEVKRGEDIDDRCQYSYHPPARRGEPTAEQQDNAGDHPGDNSGDARDHKVRRHPRSRFFRTLPDSSDLMPPTASTRDATGGRDGHMKW